MIVFVAELLGRAVREGASDLHLEPTEAGFRVRLRVEGELFDVPGPPAALAVPVVTRVKVLAGLDIAERRLPQDGRIRWPGEVPVDLRVSTLPTELGESVVIRVLDPRRMRTDLTALGLPDDIGRELRVILQRGEGMLVVTGPTGSGKTTTLYSALRELNAPGRKLLTIEDPIEYELDGVVQVATDARCGLGFATVLRAFLRQDPDVILVGEIRDAETAHVATQAALTGHLVLATLHTEDAPGAVSRLVDLGIEPSLVAAVLRGVLAQRIVRRPAGSGPGRTGRFQWLRINEQIRGRIASGAGYHEIRQIFERSPSFSPL